MVILHKVAPFNYYKGDLMKNLILFVCICASIFTAHADLDSLVNVAKKFAIEQVAAAQNTIPNDKFARYTGPDGTWQSVGKTDWTAGFYPGYLWLAHELSNDPSIRQSAEKSTSQLESMQYDKSTHDIGFTISTSYGNGYRLTNNQNYKSICDTAARSLSTRHNANIRAIRSWSWGEWASTFCVIVDNMMNLELLYFGAKNGGQPEWATYATNHAYRTAQDHIRADGSTFHLVTYNENTGAAIKKRSFYAGLTDNATWACGQAWTLYGFTMAYRESRKDSLLQSAQKTADWYLKNLPADHVPYWDFSAQQTGYRDAAAGAIALSGILELCTLVTTDSLRNRYFAEACSIMTSLCGSGYLAKGKNTAGILLHGHGDADNEKDVSLIYADYYFMQSIVRYQAYRIKHPTAAKERKFLPVTGKSAPAGGIYNAKGQSLNHVQPKAKSTGVIARTADHSTTVQGMQR
jgi:unsaturated chondroitin disaccharide hydrolase